MTKISKYIKNDKIGFMESKNITKKVLICLLSGLAYFLTTYPLRNAFAVFTITDVRPGCAIALASYICFGPCAALGCALSNLLSDYLTGQTFAVQLEGLPLQFLYGIISYYLWKSLTKNDEHRYRIDSAIKYIKVTIVCLVYALVSSLGVGLIFYLNYVPNILDITKFVFLNNFTFPMILLFPILIVMNIIVSSRGKEKARKLGSTEKVIIGSSLLKFIGITIIAIIIINSGNYNETYAIWNKIYIDSMLYVNILSGLTILVTLIIDKTLNNNLKS